MDISPNHVTHVALSNISRDPNQPRHQFDKVALKSLAQDIALVGIQQPITIRANPKKSGHWLIVYGERRYRASKLAKLATAPCLLYSGATNELDLLLNQVKENSQREELNPMEWAQLFHAMQQKHAMSYATVASTLKEQGVGKFNRTQVATMARLLTLPKWIQNLIIKKELSASHGKYLLPVMQSERVMARIEQQIVTEKKTFTTASLQSEIYKLFLLEHQRPTSPDCAFNYQTNCVDSGCQKQRKLTHPTQGETVFCLDDECFKASEARAHACEDGSSNTEEVARPEPVATPQAIPHAVPLFNAPTDTQPTETTPRKKVLQLITQQMEFELATHSQTANALAAWYGFGCLKTSKKRTYYTGRTLGDFENNLENTLEHFEILTLKDLFNAPPEKMKQAMSLLIKTAPEDDIIHIWKALNLDVDVCELDPETLQPVYDELMESYL